MHVFRCLPATQPTCCTSVATTPIFPERIAGAEAAADAINAAGGIGGRPVQILSCDQKNDAAAEATCTAVTNGHGIYNIADDDGMISIAKAHAELGFNPAFRLPA